MIKLKYLLQLLSFVGWKIATRFANITLFTMILHDYNNERTTKYIIITKGIGQQYTVDSNTVNAKVHGSSVG